MATIKRAPFKQIFPPVGEKKTQKSCRLSDRVPDSDVAEEAEPEQDLTVEEFLSYIDDWQNIFDLDFHQAHAELLTDPLFEPFVFGPHASDRS